MFSTLNAEAGPLCWTTISQLNVFDEENEAEVNERVFPCAERFARPRESSTIRTLPLPSAQASLIFPESSENALCEISESSRFWTAVLRFEAAASAIANIERKIRKTKRDSAEICARSGCILAGKTLAARMAVKHLPIDLPMAAP